MGIGRLIALIEPENGASERVAVKVGMRLEKEVIRPGGEVRKMYVVVRLVNLMVGRQKARTENQKVRIAMTAPHQYVSMSEMNTEGDNMCF